MGDVMEGWHDFFVAEAGAAAALAGLLFVAVSINLSRILEFPNLPTRVIEALSALIAVLFIASFALVPHQSVTITGMEIAGTGLLLLAINIASLRTDLKHSPAMRVKSGRRVARILANQLPPLPFIIGGGLLTFGQAAGAAFFLPGTLLCFLAGLFSAWVLLVEIQR